MDSQDRRETRFKCRVVESMTWSLFRGIFGLCLCAILMLSPPEVFASPPPLSCTKFKATDYASDGIVALPQEELQYCSRTPGGIDSVRLASPVKSYDGICAYTAREYLHLPNHEGYDLFYTWSFMARQFKPGCIGIFDDGWTQISDDMSPDIFKSIMERLTVDSISGAMSRAKISLARDVLVKGFSVESITLFRSSFLRTEYLARILLLGHRKMMYHVHISRFISGIWSDSTISSEVF